MVLYPHFNVFFLHFLQLVIQYAHCVRKKEIQIWISFSRIWTVMTESFDGHALNLCNTEILMWPLTLLLDRQSPLSYKSIWRLTSFQQKIEIYRNSADQLWKKKNHEIRFISSVALWKSGQSGLPCLSVCYTSVYCKGCNCITSQRRRPCHKSIYSVFLSRMHIFISWIWFFLWHCFTDLIVLRVTLKMLLFITRDCFN